MYAIQVTFGHSSRQGDPVDPHHISAAEDQILATFALLFHGGRLHQERGSFQTDDGLLMLENCTIASCESQNLDNRRVHALRETLCRIREALDQEMVLLTIVRINGKHHWISQ